MAFAQNVSKQTIGDVTVPSKSLLDKFQSFTSNVSQKATKNVGKLSSNTKSLLENLKSLTSNVSQKTAKDVGQLSSTISAETSNISEEISENNSLTIIFTIIRYILAFLILGFVLFNILAVVGLLPPSLAEIFDPILLSLDYTPKKKYKKSENIVTSTDNIEENDLFDSTPSMQKLKRIVKKNKSESIPNADDAGSRTQLSQSSRKSGYCYIGEDRGFRSCIKVNENDDCISGQIFPTKDICIHPSLR